MTDLNCLVLIGRVVRDLDEKSFGYIGNGNARATVTLAVNRSVKRGDKWEDEASFIDVTIWGKTAENLKPYLTKGQKIAIKGFVKQDKWEKDGQKFSKISITAEEVNLLGGKSEGGSATPTQGGFKPKDNPAYIAPTASMSYSEDIPF